jgi:hypothetical protein
MYITQIATRTQKHKQVIFPGLSCEGLLLNIGGGERGKPCISIQFLA